MDTGARCRRPAVLRAVADRPDLGLVAEERGDRSADGDEVRFGDLLLGFQLGDLLLQACDLLGERRDSVREWLDSSADTDKVQRMVAGVRKQGIEGVPFYILNRKLAVSGAQSAAVLGAALLQSLETGKPS